MKARNRDKNKVEKQGESRTKPTAKPATTHDLIAPVLDVTGPGNQLVEVTPDYRVTVLEATEGNLTAFEQLYQLHADQIYRYVYYRVSNQSDAEDLVAQVFLQAWGGITNYKPNGSPFVAWLYTIAHNLVVNYYKKSERQAKFQLPLADWVADVQGQQDPERELNIKLRNEALRRAILQLGPEQQQVIYFRYVEDWSHQQIAALLDKTEAAVRVIQFRAQRALRQLLEKDGWNETFNQV